MSNRELLERLQNEILVTGHNLLNDIKPGSSDLSSVPMQICLELDRIQQSIAAELSKPSQNEENIVLACDGPITIQSIDDFKTIEQLKSKLDEAQKELTNEQRVSAGFKILCKNKDVKLAEAEKDAKKWHAILECGIYGDIYYDGQLVYSYDVFSDNEAPDLNIIIETVIKELSNNTKELG